MFEQALIREIKQRDLKEGEGETLRKIASQWIEKALGGDPTFSKELRDTLDGKPVQSVEASGPDGGAIVTRVERVLVDGTTPRNP